MREDHAPGTDWLLLFTSSSRVSLPASLTYLDDDVDLGRLEVQAGVQDGTPILISPDLDIDPRLVEYFARSIRFTEQAKLGRDVYAREMRIWVAFLWRRGLRWDEAEQSDFAEFKRWRTDPDLQRKLSVDGSVRVVSGATFNKSFAALTAFYSWATDPSRRYLAHSPIPARSRVGYNSRRPEASARSARSKWVTPTTFKVWRDVGLMGYSLTREGRGVAAGALDTSWRGGRNLSRDRAYVDLMITTALRRSEQSTLLVLELPSESMEIRLSSAVAKFNRARIWTPLPESLEHIQKYIRFNRDAGIARAQKNGRYDDVQKLMVERTTFHPKTGHLLHLESGRSLLVAAADESLRLRLFSRDSRGLPAPLMVFLADDGLPMTAKGWNKVFARANKRVSDEFVRLGLPIESTIHISPHSLRFSFALYLLVALHRRIDKLEGRDSMAPYDERNYRRAFNTVRDLLGHAHVSTTEDTYLEPVKGLRSSLLTTRSAALSDLGALIDRISEGSESILDSRTLVGDH